MAPVSLVAPALQPAASDRLDLGDETDLHLGATRQLVYVVVLQEDLRGEGKRVGAIGRGKGRLRERERKAEGALKKG